MEMGSPAEPTDRYRTQAPQQVSRKQLLTDAIQATTAHGLSRTVGDRHLVMRLFWVAAFLLMLGLFINQLASAAVKLQSMPVSTSVDPASESFVFPDVHICSVAMVSASYPSHMEAAAMNYTEAQFANIRSLLALVNATSGSSEKMAAPAFLSSVQRSFLSRHFGMRKEQTVITATLYPSGKSLQLGVDITDVAHHRNLNCFRVRVKNSTDRSLLNSVMGCLDLVLFADATYNQTLRLYGDSIDARGLAFSNYDSLISSGLRLTFTAKDTYPDDYGTSVVLCPGFKHFIKLSMTHVARPAAKGQCADSLTDVQLLDENAGVPVAYQQNLAVCYANNFHWITWHYFGCRLAGFFPTDSSFGSLPYCYNFSSHMQGNLSKLDDPGLIKQLRLLQVLSSGAQSLDLVNAMNYIQTQCQYQMPCSEVQYAASLSAGIFPVKQGYQTNLAAVMDRMLQDRLTQGYSVPGLDWLTRQLMTANSSAERASVAEAVSDNVVRALICPGEFRSASIAQTVSFDWDDFLAYCGGLMGLFMGASVLTLVELLDLLACMLGGWRVMAARCNSVNDSRERVIGASCSSI